MQHLAIIMDGNRRWAKSRFLPVWMGHKQGVQTVEMVMKYCLENSIPYLSLYAFSLENLGRDQTEKDQLFLVIDELKDRVKEFNDHNIQLRFVGDLNFLPKGTQETCHFLQQATEKNTQLVCNILICYGSQQEIIHAVQSCIADRVDSDYMQAFKKRLWMGKVPDPEVIIRTGNVFRLSNFLLFQAAYAEIRFLSCMWPDLTKQLLDETVKEALSVVKRFGR